MKIDRVAIETKCGTYLCFTVTTYQGHDSSGQAYMTKVMDHKSHPMCSVEVGRATGPTTKHEACEQHGNVVRLFATGEYMMGLPEWFQWNEANRSTPTPTVKEEG